MTQQEHIFRSRTRGGRRGRRWISFLFTQQGRWVRGNRDRDDRTTYTRTNDLNGDKLVAGLDGESHPCVICFDYNFVGHYRDQCPYTTCGGVQVMHVGCTFTQGALFNIPKSWLLLDTYFTCDVSNNPDLVTNIQVYLQIGILATYTNGGVLKYENLAELQLIPITMNFRRTPWQPF